MKKSYTVVVGILIDILPGCVSFTKVDEHTDIDYVRCVFMVAFQNIVGPVHRMMVKEGLVSREKWMDYLYEMVVKALVHKNEYTRSL